MDRTDREEFAKLIGGLCVTFDKQPTPTLMDAYWVALGDLSIGQVRRGVTTCMRESKFFPKPAEIREHVTEGGDVRAIAAWGLVLRAMPLGAYRHVCFADQTINAAIRTLGGWPAMFERCATTEGEKWYRVDFEKAYKAMDGRVGDAAGAPLAGLAEASVCNGKRVPPRITLVGHDGVQKLLPPGSSVGSIENRQRGGEVARISFVDRQEARP